MKTFDIERAKEILNELHPMMGAREKAFVAAKLFNEMRAHYEWQIAELEARVKVLEQDVILAELTRIRNLSERILKEVEPRENPDV